MAKRITPDSILAEVTDIAEAKAIAKDMRATLLTVEAKYGLAHATTRVFVERYFDFVDAMALKFGKA